MLELNITKYFEENDPYYMSGSVANLGSDAAKFTWNNCLEASDGELLNSEEDCQETRNWLRSFGAWSDDEINSWTKTELEAFILQDAARGINEMIAIYERDYDEEILSTQEIIELISNDEDYQDDLGNIYTHEDQLMIVIE
jgi:glutaredoxin 2